MAVQQQQINPSEQVQQPPQQPQWQPTLDIEKTRRTIKHYQEYPHRYKEEQLEELRKHAQYHNVPFYEGEFSIFDAIKQAGGGFIEGFTTLRVADPPDNEWEAVARNVGHLAGFVPGILSSPLKALGIMTRSRAIADAAMAVGRIKSVPMLGADFVTKHAKKIINPALKGAIGSRFKAADAASKFFLKDKAAHMAEGAFHLGVASSISSVWDGVDQMMHSFVGGAAACGVFRLIGNVVTGTTTGDKVIKGLAGSLFMGLPATYRGATTPEQIYEYLAGAYFGSKEVDWITHRARVGMQDFQKQMKTNPKFEFERQVKDMDGFDKYPEIVQNKMIELGKKQFLTREQNLAMAEEMMAQHGILDRIPKKDWTTTGYKTLSAIRKGIQRRTRYKAHDDLGAAASGAAKGADSLWSLEANKFGFPTIHMIPETFTHKKTKDKFFEDLKAGRLRGVDRGVSSTELLEAGPKLNEANLTLKRGDIDNYSPFAYELLARNWFQVKGAQSLYAVAPLEQGKKTVKGGTGWAVQMALDKGLQHVYVYDPTVGNKSWFKWTPEVNRFKAIDFTPKLRRNPALVGSRQINPGGEGHQAIKDVMEVTFGKVIKGPKSPIKGALKEEDVKIYHQKTLENIRNIEIQISEKRDHLKDIKSDLQKGQALGKVRMKELMVEEKKVKAEIDDLYKEIQFKHRVLEPTQYRDMTTGLTINDIDTGMVADKFTLMKKGEYFSNTHLKDLWDKESTVQSKRDSMLNFAKITESIIRKHVKKGDKNVDITKSVKLIERVFSTKDATYELKEPAKLELRKWMRELNLGRQVIHVKTSGSAREVPGFTHPSRPTSSSGMAVRQVESPKLIEEVYTNEGGKLEKGKSPSALVIFDTVGRKNKHGFRIDVPLNKLATHIKFAEKKENGKRYSEEEANDIVKNIKADIIKKLLKSDNLYPFGGQGDKGRVVFVKLHPKLKGMGEAKIRLAYLNLIKTIRRNIKKNKIDNQALLMLNRHRKAMQSGYGLKPKDFEKMVVSNLMYDLSLNGYKYSPENIAKIMKPGFIGNAVAFNKRHQIWMTNGYAGSKNYIKNAVNENGEKILDDLSPNDNLKYRLIDDPELPDALKKTVLKARSSQLGEDVDGAILSRDDAVSLLNKDAGHPESGQQKSFIVDNTPEYTPKGEVNRGALLGKYMIHNVGPKASKAMKDAGLHFLIMKSAAKQTGERISGKYDVKADDSLVLTGGRTYELNPESIKYSTSVVQDAHMAQKQIWVKQLFTNLHQFSETPIPKSVIDDIHKEVIGKAFKGNKLFNDVLLEYKMTKDPEKINFLVKNLEELGTAELIETLKTPGAERFAEVALQKMLRIVESDIESQYQDGTLSSEQRFEAIRHFTEAVSPIDRLLKNSAIVGEEANMAGETGYPAYMHKFVRDYRQAVLHNYFVKTITRPKQDNSLLARMRPYDKWMQKDFKELDKSDTIFYLDEAYRDTLIRLDNGEKKNLGWLWDNYQNDSKYSKYFDALVLRVPMDSISGAHRLRFKGFTGRKGHGVMLNSKTMRALGGADLDGDEAFVYFGGKNEDGSGYGMKKSWMDAIHANKGEYYNKAGDHVEDNKKSFIQHGPHKGKRFSEVLAIGTDIKENPLKESKALYYSPLARLNASEGAVAGRDLLGRVVTHSQVMKSTFSALMEAPDKTDTFVIEKGYGRKKKRYRVTVTPKDGKKDLAYQREMTRAQTAFASDPMDEVALREYDHFFNTLNDAYFNKSFEVYNRTTKKYEALKEIPENITPSDYYGSNLKGGKSLLGAFKNMNSAYFGRNWSEGRRHSMDEVNYMASDIGILSEAQKNTILPKMVDTLEGLDWSDNLFNRVNRKSIEKTYEEIQGVLDDKGNRFGTWLKDAMNRSSFSVIYNDHIKAVVVNKLNDRHVRHKIALKDDIPSLREFRRIVKHSIWGKEFEQKAERLKKLYSYEERLKILEQMHRQAEDFLSNDVATMATIKALDRILKKHRIDPKQLARIHSAVSKFKARSYLSRRERGQLDYDAFSGSQKEMEDMQLTKYLMDDVMGGKKKQQDLIGDKRSTVWDQMQLDKKIRQYKDGLKNDAERELFDHLFIGTLNRGDMHKVNRLINNLPSRKHSPMFRELMSRIIKETARTTQSRLALNSEEISPIAIQNHLKSMNEVFVKMWKPSKKESLEGTTIGVENVINETGLGEEGLMDKLVMGAYKGSGYAGIKKGEVSKEDKAIVTEIATILKRYNRKVEGALPDLNEQMRGITAVVDPQGMGKDLNAFNKQDFILVRNYLREVEGGTLMQKIRKASEKPEIMKRYYSYFPDTTNRELMAYDILWLKKKQWYLTKAGKIEEGYVKRPTFFLEMLMQQAHKNNSLATGKAEVLAKDIEQQFINLDELKEGNGLFQIAIAQAELGNKQDIDARKDLQDIIKKHWKLNYDTERTVIEKEHNWSKLKDKEFTILNDANERVTATGLDIVNGNRKLQLTGIKKKVADRFESLFELISGDGVSINKYKTGKHFDPDLKMQPKLNWTLFVKDMEKAFEKGDDIPMNIGIDGMRHLMRSMMVDLAETSTQRKKYSEWIIKETGKIDFAKYWPHMFFDKRTAERNMKRTLEFIKNNSELTEAQKKQAIANLVLRHKTVTGDWEFQDMQDWDRVDVMEVNEALKEIAMKKKERHETVKWTDMNSKFGSMMSRKAHIGGWSKDMNVMNAYVRNITGTYYRQINQIMSRKTIHDAKKRMTKKFGSKIAKNWDRYFKLYVQGAMGQPDVIPKSWYDDPAMNLKGTPYAWFADNRVLDRVNKIRERLGIRESDLPKELKDFTYQDIRHWSNMEAKFELATLLAHPKTAITNIFGGSLHTIQSTGHKAFLKARSIKFLKRINPEWNSIKDVEEWVVKKGVVPEFMIHELGLGQQAKTVKSIESFIGELSSKINSPDKISRQEIKSLGKKYRLSDRVVSKASKFMSVPERTLRRDAFMAHYIRAWERFGGAIKDPNHPFLIEMGKKGVKATQFLYEAPNRPFFARTALGKIMSRFQLFAWNSWRFRNDVVREARRYGFKEGTEAGDRFARTMQIDLFVLALGNMFLYSLFDNALPQPWGWFQDTADWIFGDEKERERAFFGAYPTAVAPLQIITPPLARFPVSGLMQWARDDYTKFSEYQVYTMFPFGRMIRDIVQPNKGLIDNPSRLLEKIAGMPLRDLQKFTTERKKKIEEGTRWKQPKVGF